MAIAAVLGVNSRVYSGGCHHEDLHIGFHVRLRHHLTGHARATHPRHSSEHRSLGKHLRGHRTKMRASHRTQQASAVRGTGRGHFATGRAHIKRRAVGRLSVARTENRDPRLCLDSTIANVNAKNQIEEKSFNSCVEDIASAKVVSHSSEGVGLAIDLTNCSSTEASSTTTQCDALARNSALHGGAALEQCSYASATSSFSFSTVGGCTSNDFLFRLEATTWPPMATCICCFLHLLGCPFSWHNVALGRQDGLASTSISSRVSGKSRKKKGTKPLTPSIKYLDKEAELSAPTWNVSWAF